MRVYEGTRLSQDAVKVTVTDADTGKVKALPLTPSLKVRNHSPTGFEWGYGGSGPAQLALAIMLDYHPCREVAESVYMDFKFKYVAGWGPTWRITEEEIDAWLMGVIREREARQHA